MSRLTTVRIGSSTRAGRVEGDDIVILDAADVGEVLRRGEVAETGDAIPRAAADLAPLVTSPGKIVCVGVNYLDHIEEMGRDRPSAPTYFAKYDTALIGALDDMVLPSPSSSVPTSSGPSGDRPSNILPARNCVVRRWKSRTEPSFITV